MPDVERHISVRAVDASKQWCNACSTRPPYEPNRVTVVRTRQMEMTYCPICTGVLLAALKVHYERDMKVKFVGATYVNAMMSLSGQHALVRAHPTMPMLLLAQFDNIVYRANVDLSRGWHPFFRSHFMIEGEIE